MIAGWRRVGGVVGAGTLIVAVCGVGQAAGAATPAPLTARQIADRDQPAIDLIETETTATLTVYLPTLDIASVVSFAQNDNAIQQALTQGDAETAARDIIGEIAKNVQKYMSKGDGTSYNADIGAQGSGFTVTPDGFIVTNAHVGSVDPSDAASQFLGTLPADQLTAIQQAFIQQFTGLTNNGTPITIPSDQQDAVLNLLGDFVGSTADVRGLSTKITVFQGAESANTNGMDATLLTAGKPFPDKDVAILKVDAQNLPTIPVGDDGALHDGDPVYAIGYPGDATFDKSVIKTTRYTSTISAGIVSNRLQSSAANYQYIEHTATTNHGNSGGALINSAGEVVGITTASDASTEAQNGVNGGKFFYCVPTAVVKDFLSQSHVTPAAAPGQAQYNQGIAYVEANNLGKARKKLLQAQSAGYNTPYLVQMLALTNSAANSSSGGGGSGGAIAAVAGGGVAVIVIGGVVLLLVRRRSRGGGGPVRGDRSPGYGPGVPPEAPGWSTPPPPYAPPVSPADEASLAARPPVVAPPPVVEPPSPPPPVEPPSPPPPGEPPPVEPPPVEPPPVEPPPVEPPPVEPLLPPLVESSPPVVEPPPAPPASPVVEDPPASPEPPVPGP